jgi:hypothetical protein
MTDEELGRLTALEARVAAAEARVAVLERRERGPSVEAVRAFLMLPSRVKRNAFSLAELFQRAARLGDADLLSAFAAANASTPRKAWRMFRQLEGRDIDGFRLTRLRGERDGVSWCIVRV